MSDLIFDSTQLARQHVEIAQKIQSEPGVTWGVPSIDRNVIPMRGGDVAVICGRPGHGKTTILTYLAREEARRIVARGKAKEETVVYVTWEGTVDMIYMSIVAGLGGYSSTDYAWGRVPIRDIEKNVSKRGVMPITMIGLSTVRKAKYPQMTLDEILRAIRHIEEGKGTPKRKVTLVCLDYLQLIKMLGRDERRDRVAEAIIGVKDLGMELDIPAFVGAQAARRVDDYNHKLPKMNDIQWSCVAGDSRLISAETGISYTAEQVYEMFSRGHVFDIHSLQEDTLTMVRNHIYDAKKNPPERVYRVSCGNSGSVVVNNRHRFYTPGGWTKLSELEPGDWIALAGHIPVDPRIEDINDNRAYIIGLLLGDGMVKRNQVTFTNSDMEILDSFKDVIEREFPGYTVNVYKQAKWDVYNSTVRRVDGKIFPGGNDVLNWLKKIGMIGQECHDKHIPPLRMKDSAVASVISGLLVTDGSVYISQGRLRVVFSSASELLIYQVRDLLLRLGISCGIRFQKKGNSGIWMLYVSNNDIAKFSELVNIPGHKGRRLREFIANDMDRCGGDLLPPEWNMDAIEIAKDHGLRGIFNNVKGRAIKRDRMLSIAEATDSNRLTVYAKSEVTWRKITKIEALEPEHTYDFSVSRDHNFVVNGFVTHNSQAEQHTDKLFSLWRPSLTEEPPVGFTEFAIQVGNNTYDVNDRLILVQMLKQRWDQGRFLWGLHLQPELLRLADLERNANVT